MAASFAARAPCDLFPTVQMDEPGVFNERGIQNRGISPGHKTRLLPCNRTCNQARSLQIRPGHVNVHRYFGSGALFRFLVTAMYGIETADKLFYDKHILDKQLK